MDQLSTAAFSMAIGAALIYAWLRTVARQDNRPALLRARSHSFWCALIAFFVSSSGGVSNQQAAHAGAGESLWASDLLAATGPALWLLSIYLIGLYSWPASVANVRAASLEPRSMMTPLPKALSAVAALVLLGAGLTLWMIRDVTGVPPQYEVASSDAYGSTWVSQSATDGLRAADQMLALFAINLASLALALLIAMLFILLRKPLGSLSPHDNQVLREVWLNRLLRTSILAFASVGASSLHYKASWLMSLDRTMYQPWQNTANVAMLITFIAMALWKPPENFARTTSPKPASSFLRMRENLFAIGFLTTALTLIALACSSSLVQTEYADNARPGENAPQAIVSLLVVALLFLVLNAGFLGYLHLKSRGTHSLARHSADLPRYVYVLAGLLLIGATYLLINPPFEYFWGLVPVKPVFALGALLALLAATACHIWWVRRAALPWDVTVEQEIWYRQVHELRALRVVTAAAVAMLAWGYEAGPYVSAVGIIVFCCPAVIILARPETRVPQRV
ncbi:hypothetical protein ACT3UD_15490 [Glutamicibacter sp. 287]|uniref:hypothetical protein n=1 Tax=unclassified Glutamicibacter TaxID=2627139 RepID=UPI000BB911F9|nr:hypothetical protein [Glutamicibacter sp. BW80]PCC30627.1 hypothetical protein CIK76_01155 [Glutamicibacter sp. BW80]